MSSMGKHRRTRFRFLGRPTPVDRAERRLPFTKRVSCPERDGSRFLVEWGGFVFQFSGTTADLGAARTWGDQPS